MPKVIKHLGDTENQKTMYAWCSYDWANSVYNLIITTAIFPIYYDSVTKAAFGGDRVTFFGLSIQNSVLYSYAISFSFFIASVLYPVFSGIADHSGSKKAFMRFFTYLGSLACAGLYFFEGSNIELGLLLAVIASMSYASSVVFYNAFLPEITTADRMDKVSAQGFAMGYIGSVLLLIISLVLIQMPDAFGFDGAGSATRFVFLLTGIWWFGFAHIALSVLKDKKRRLKITSSLLQSGLQELGKVFAILKSHVHSLRFLYAFFFYSMGVQTVMLLAPLFAAQEIGMESTEMILVILIIQLVAIGGAYLFAYLSKVKGNKFSIVLAILLWLLICLSAFSVKDKAMFYALAGLLGLVMGGIQSTSRSTYAKLIPPNSLETASFFSFYDVTEKGAIVLGTLSFGMILHLTGTMRNSMLFMALFFIIAFAILLRVKLQFFVESQKREMV